jgi:hypothetical protein
MGCSLPEILGTIWMRTMPEPPSSRRTAVIPVLNAATGQRAGVACHQADAYDAEMRMCAEAIN